MEVNDRVIVHRQSRPYERDRLAIGKIVGETKTSWRVKYGDGLDNPVELFRKNDLHLRGADSYSCTRISEWDDEDWRAYESELCRMTAANNLKRTNWNEFDKETLHKIYKIINDARREKRERLRSE